MAGMVAATIAAGCPSSRRETRCPVGFGKSRGSVIACLAFNRTASHDTLSNATDTLISFPIETTEGEVLQQALQILAWIGGIVLAVGAVFGLLILPHNVRVWRVRHSYRRLPPQVQEQVLAAIRAAAQKGRAVTFLRLARGCAVSEPPIVTESHVGGIPYAESPDQWPDGGRNETPRFLLQVRLTDPGLGPIWHGRLIEVFLVFDYEQLVRSYATPSPDRFTPLTPPLPPFPYVPIVALPFPIAHEDGDARESIAYPSQLCETIPEIRELLRPYTKDFAGLLTQILCPDIYGYDFETPFIAFEGGSPELIQSPHEPTCDRCRQPMRFLFQFGEIIPNLQLADAGVGYVYGCDEHPEFCKTFIDSH
jgi:hypothetical protein